LPAGGPGPRELARALGELAGADLADDLLHGYSFAGHAAHRAAGARWLVRRGVDAELERTLVTGGAQHAMAMIFATLARPGDTVLCEAATYPGAKAFAELFGLELFGVEMDGEGLLPDALDAACRRTGARVLYTMPTVHNPMGVVLSEERRERVTEIARERGLSIVEDDSYGFLCESAPPPFAQLAPERTYFVTSLSKCLASGLRIGFLHAPAGVVSIVERLVTAGAALAWMAAPLMAELAARWIDDGTLERSIAEKRAESRARRELARKILPGIDPSADPASCHVWLALAAPWKGEDFAARAAQRGVSVTGPGAFVAGRAPVPVGVRLCLGTPSSRKELARGLELLREILSGRTDAWPALV
jgi:DNA-binding transcriptional MocR family regulator